ncbi:thermonuclease family protein [Altererythrobacter arenosus]|uniref:Thermonuclease family protein n=1 Tax=Altererythrobacter arenosus TaxID=3032592 RepID=A0ABY8G209_9SPHN|nr:thermonuclease family protein [Altererythrobacter sp. CAU 1644]WFL79054.1 thermonuclease family protein [Altererythrobacter sp. CAU 1644]
MIRLHGIDAVERSQHCSRNGEAWRCGEDAAQFLASLLRNGRLSCRQVDLDQYGRQVSICTVSGRDLAAEIVRAGWAVALPQFSETYVELEAVATQESVGIWSSQFETPADYRASNPSESEPRPALRRQRQTLAPAHPSSRGSAYYQNCASARAAGAAPIRRGQPGYRPELDADNDGVACEPYRNRR